VLIDDLRSGELGIGGKTITTEQARSFARPPALATLRSNRVAPGRGSTPFDWPLTTGMRRVVTSPDTRHEGVRSRIDTVFVWFARADGASRQAVGVVDAFLNARAARDVNAVAAVFDKDAQILGGGYDLATGTEGLYQLLPLGETIEAGARTQA
jgi:hypothetical protein